MKYLARKRKPRVAHLWNDARSDTFCRMWSTGGLKQSKYAVYDENALDICLMCQNVERELGLLQLAQEHDARTEGRRLH